MKELLRSIRATLRLTAHIALIPLMVALEALIHGLSHLHEEISRV